MAKSTAISVYTIQENGGPSKTLSSQPRENIYIRGA